MPEKLIEVPELHDDGKLMFGDADALPWIVRDVNLLPGRSAINRIQTAVLPLEEEIENWNTIAEAYINGFRFQ